MSDPTESTDLIFLPLKHNPPSDETFPLSLASLAGWNAAVRKSKVVCLLRAESQRIR
jgi:hypothetical protein